MNAGRGAGIFLLLLALGLGLAEVAAQSGAGKSPAAERALRRAFDGAPPVIPHERFPSPCIECHNERGMEVVGVGFAPPSPHELTGGMSDMSRCRQCHVFSGNAPEFVGNSFVGLRQDLRSGRRQNPFAPPVMPHLALMRENCLACHTGPSAREEIRTTHPDRGRCRQCHLEQQTTERFRR